MAIPFKSLRFRAGSAPQTWGIALRRRLAEKNENAFWPGITDRISGFASQFAEARGLAGVSPGRNVQVIPYGAESMERFAGVEFREHENWVSFSTSYLRWMDFFVAVSNGARPNFPPRKGIPAFLADFRDGQLSLTFRPTSRLLLDQTYLYSRLAAPAHSGHSGTIFGNHIIRSRVNYQFTRELSVRGIVDYAVLSNPDLVALDRTKHLTADVLITYLLKPGTALYIGVTDGFDNVALDGSTALRPTRNPTTSTGRQFFVKTSDLFRF